MVLLWIAFKIGFHKLVYKCCINRYLFGFAGSSTMTQARSPHSKPSDGTPNRSPSLHRAAFPSPGRRKEKCASQEPGKGLQLHGDIKALEFAFVAARRRLVGTTVSESLLAKMQAHPGGIGAFYEEAVGAFNGDLEALVAAAVQFMRDRKRRSHEDPIRIANGRVEPETFEKIQKIETALASIRGMSRAKVIAGLVQLAINHPSTDGRV